MQEKNAGGDDHGHHPERGPAPDVTGPVPHRSERLQGKTLFVAGQVSCSSSRVYVKHYERFIRSHGCALTERAQEADIILVDTCAYSHEKERLSLSTIKEQEALAKEGAKVIVCGCLAGINPQRLQEHFGGEFFSPKDEGQLAYILGLDEEEARFLTPVEARGRMMGGDFEGGSPLMRLLTRAATLVHEVDHRVCLMDLPLLGKLLAYSDPASPHTYALNVSQGCLGKCSFCVIPLAKGQTLSLPVGLIVDKIRGVVEGGVRHVLLTSEDVGAYGKDIGTDFNHLLGEIQAIPGDFFLNVTHYDPRWLRTYGAGLIDLLRAGKVRHMRLPLQSGSDAVLGRMRRTYRIEHVLPVLREMRRALPRLAMSTQLIAGFPGETGEEFAATRAILHEGLFDMVEVFPFSNRRGAETEGMEGHLAQEVVERRAAQLRRDFWRGRLRRLVPFAAALARN